MIKIFPLRDVLTVTTGRLLTKSKDGRGNGIENLHDIMDFMLDATLFTHMLPKARESCNPALLEQFPELQIANEKLYLLEDFLENYEDSNKSIDTWLQMCTIKWKLKENYSVRRI